MLIFMKQQLVLKPSSVAPFISSNPDPERYRVGPDGYLHERRNTAVRKVPPPPPADLMHYRRMIPFVSEDKRNHEKWTADRDLASFPKPFRVLFVGPPGVGKTTSLKNVLTRMVPQFAHVVVVSRKGTNEWAEYVEPDNPVATYEIVDRLPLPRDVFEKFFEDCEDHTETGYIPLDVIFPPHEDDLPKLIILDDHSWDDLSVPEREGLARLMNYSSTHNFISVAVLCQDGFNMIKPVIRRAFNVIVAFAFGADRSNLSLLLRNNSVPDAITAKLIPLLRKKQEFICVDKTAGTPAPIRVRDYWTKCIVRDSVMTYGVNLGHTWHVETDDDLRDDNENGLIVL
jgi:hypothetical protein